MANPFGEIAGKIAGEVAEGLAKKAAPVVAKTAKKAVKAVEDKADDWGWKGGKKGEVTGGDMEKASDKYEKNKNIDEYKKVADKAAKQLTESLSRKPDSPMAKYYGTKIDSFWSQPKDVLGRVIHGSYDAYDVLSPFRHLEKADIPRAWTGKVMNALIKKRGPIANIDAAAFAKDISKFMRPLTNEQRDTFVSLYPEWNGSLEDLARAARTL